MLLNPTAKLSIVRVMAGQTTEGAILENGSRFPPPRYLDCLCLLTSLADEGHGDFREFLSLLGERVALKGWKDFAANLNTTDNSHGTHSVYTRMQDFEVMFHVGPLIAYTSDKQVCVADSPIN